MRPVRSSGHSEKTQVEVGAGQVESVAITMEIGTGRDAEQFGQCGGCWGRWRLDFTSSDRSRWRKIPNVTFFWEDV